jgi:hypothetical protein
VQNEPNLAGRPGLRRPNCAKQSQTCAGWDIWGQCARRRAIVQNKANSRRAGPLGPDVQTKPICRRGARKTIAKARGLDDATPSGERANKANLPPGQPAEPSLGPIVQNEPNSCHRGRSCETKPIPGSAGGARHGGRGAWRAIVQNEPNLAPVSGNGRAGRPRGGLGRRSIAQNGPNFCHRADHAKQDAPDKSLVQPKRPTISARKRRSKPNSATFVVRVKQSQFPAAPGQSRHGGRGAWRAIVQNEANARRSVEYEVSSVKLENPASSLPSLPASNFTLPTSNEPPPRRQCEPDSCCLRGGLVYSLRSRQNGVLWRSRLRASSKEQNERAAQ